MEDGEEEELNTKKPSGSYSASEQGEQAPPAYVAGSVRSEPADGGKGGKKNDDNKKANRCALIVAIFGLLFALAAIVPTVFCQLLWWYWVWTITAPALFLGFIGIILAAVKKREAALCCAGFAIVLGLAAIVWGSFEIIQTQSYQGALAFETQTIKYVKESGDSKDSGILSGNFGTEDFTVNASVVSSQDDALMKAYHYHLFGRYCKGRAYDWGHRKTVIADEVKCRRKTEDWFIKKFVTVSGSRYEGCGTDHAFEGVDTYEDSPVYLTHKDTVDAKKYVYASKDLKKENQKELDEFCKDFKVEKFKEDRDNCDKQIKSAFEPKCKKENGGQMFTKGFDEIKKIDWAKKRIFSEGGDERLPTINDINRIRNAKLKKELDKEACEARLLEYEAPNPLQIGKIKGKIKVKAKPIYEESKYKKILMASGIMKGVEEIFADAKFEFTKTKEVDGVEVNITVENNFVNGRIYFCQLTQEEKEKQAANEVKLRAVQKKNKYKMQIKALEASKDKEGVKEALCKAAVNKDAAELDALISTNKPKLPEKPEDLDNFNIPQPPSHEPDEPTWVKPGDPDYEEEMAQYKREKEEYDRRMKEYERKMKEYNQKSKGWQKILEDWRKKNAEYCKAITAKYEENKKKYDDHKNKYGESFCPSCCSRGDEIRYCAPKTTNLGGTITGSNNVNIPGDGNGLNFG